MSKRVNINALGMASTKNINALYNAQYIDNGIISKVKGFFLGTANSDYEKLIEKEEERRRAKQNIDDK